MAMNARLAASDQALAEGARPPRVTAAGSSRRAIVRRSWLRVHQPSSTRHGHQLQDGEGGGHVEVEELGRLPVDLDLEGDVAGPAEDQHGRRTT